MGPKRHSGKKNFTGKDSGIIPFNRGILLLVWKDWDFLPKRFGRKLLFGKVFGPGDKTQKGLDLGELRAGIWKGKTFKEIWPKEGLDISGLKNRVGKKAVIVPLGFWF